MDDTRVRQAVYLVLALCGLVGTMYFNVQWLDGEFDHSLDGFFESAFANSASSSFGIDLIVAAVAADAFIFVEGRRIGLRYWWLYVVMIAVIAFAFAFPLFLWARERHLAVEMPSPLTEGLRSAQP